MVLNLKTVNGKLRPIKDHVIVSDMYFGEQRTLGGLIINDDNGTTRGIYPRWGKVHAKGPNNTEDYSVGDWVLVDHGRWTRGVKIDEGQGAIELRMVEADSILVWSSSKPKGIQIGAEYSDGQPAAISPGEFTKL